MRRTTSVVALALCATAACLLWAPGAGAHGGDPDYRSEIKSITPPTQGLTAEIENFDADLHLVNQSGKTVIVKGYEGEPYLRFDPDGTVYANKLSSASYLNSDRYGRADVPSSVDPDATPDWQPVGTDGDYTWHDHRSHYMSISTPKQVTDPDVRTKIFDYSIPLEVDSQPGAIKGTLYWVGPPDDPAPILPFIALGLVTIGLIALVVVVRRRRRPGDGDDGGPAAPAEGSKEAW